MSLPIEETDKRPLRVIFCDLNSYFASIEQAENPSLRGKPIAVAPVLSSGGTVIAASYEAKEFGVRTGTRVGDALRMCPGLVLVDARPPVYVHYHKAILEAVESVLPVERVHSVDEMSFRLLGSERSPEVARAIALEIKAAIRGRVAPELTSSIGIAPNSFLAKVGTELQKPDGLVVIEADGIPAALADRPLTLFPGINKRIEARLKAAGIFKSDDLLARPPAELAKAFGSVIGERWWYLLRGYDLAEPERPVKSLGHSHVLPPTLRTDEGCRQVLLRLAQKACARLRANGLWADHMSVSVTGRRKSWTVESSLDPTQDTIEVCDRLLRLWIDRDFSAPVSVGVAFTGLSKREGVTPSLFGSEDDRTGLNSAVDNLNRKFGKHAVHLANVAKVRHTASEKIAFNKTWLFSEGKGDNDWTPEPTPRPREEKTRTG